MAFPSTLSTFNRPNPTDRLNSPSHSALHNTVSSAVGQIEAVIGVEGDSSVVGTLEYLIKSPASEGGGHVQGAAFGGTGQTTFTKGDILVASSPSVLTKLSAGTTGQVLTVNSSVATGVTWGNITRKLAIVASVGTVGANDPETSVLSFVIPASTLSAGTSMNTKLFISNLALADNVTVRVNMGTQSIATMTFLPQTVALTSYRGVCEINVIAGTNSSQRNIVNFYASRDRFTSQSSMTTVNAFISNTSSIVSGGSILVGVTAQWSSNTAADQFTTDGYIATLQA